MASAVSFSLSAESESSPVCDGHSGGNVCPPSLTAQPQHRAGLSRGISAHIPEPILKSSTKVAKEVMSEKKRTFATVSLPTASDFATPDDRANAEVPPESVPSPTQSLNKKRRVSFCNTTKSPSNLRNQGPFNSIQRLGVPNNVIMKHSSSCTSLPQLASSSPSLLVSEASSTDEVDLNVSPTVFVNMIVLQSKSITGSIRGEDIISDATERVKHESYYLPFTEEHLLAYTQEKVTAVQGNDVETLRALLKAGHGMHASNRFGESMLHTSCRRGFTESVEFFIKEARVCPRIRDDMGRTPMHDVCWSSAAPNHDIMKMLICAAPEMLLSKDNRGHSPFDYARRELWPNWVAFLNEHRQFIVNSLVSSFLESREQTSGYVPGSDGLSCEEGSLANQ